MTRGPGVSRETLPVPVAPVSRETLAALSALGVSRETRDRLEMFAQELVRWSASLNLVSRRDLAQLWDRHILDSAQLLPFLPPVEEFADLGSGGGFPGLVLAIISGKRVHLIESDRRKAAFLQEAARRTEAPAMIHAARAQAVTLPTQPLVTSRALAPVAELLAMSQHFTSPETIFLFPKGISAAEELTRAESGWNMQIDRYPSRLSGGGEILRICKVSPRV